MLTADWRWTGLNECNVTERGRVCSEWLQTHRHTQPRQPLLTSLQLMYTKVFWLLIRITQERMAGESPILILILIFEMEYSLIISHLKFEIMWPQKLRWYIHQLWVVLRMRLLCVLCINLINISKTYYIKHYIPEIKSGVFVFLASV